MKACKLMPVFTGKAEIVARSAEERLRMWKTNTAFAWRGKTCTTTETNYVKYFQHGSEGLRLGYSHFISIRSDKGSALELWWRSPAML